MLDKWKIFWGVLLLTLSVVFYVIHFMIFRDPHHLFIFLVGDIAFVFVEVMLVTMIIHELLNYREKHAMMYKLNMVIGAFFSEVGTELLRLFSDFDLNAERMHRNLMACHDWSPKAFGAAGRQCREYNYDIDSQRGNLEELRDFLIEKRYFLINLLQNPNLLEHDTFSDLLWAVFHLAEELEKRTDIEELSAADVKHLSIDIKRAYSLLTSEWLDYMRHLKQDYPYLFSLAMRTNPFNPEAKVEISDAS
ncbi:MAG: hypothetical protein JXO48_11825 [Deltaproteobacteria bacterium]|nr:hypothetical protein [Deltaproteobacteria bacterium]